MDDQQIALARQPILAVDGSLYAYELLHRGKGVDGDGVPVSRSAQVICEMLGAIGLDRVAGSARVFLNFEQSLLETDLPTILIPNRSVVEILEDVQPSEAVFRTLAQLRTRGIGTAIDDFVLQDNLMPFLPHVDYVKVDILEAGDQLQTIVDVLKEHQVLMLAEKVETHEQFEQCKALGFQYFQGYYFARPEPIPKRSVGAMELSVLTLMARLENRNVTAQQLTDTISIDVALVHQILVLANSGAFYRGRPITSILEAVTLLGQNLIRQWAALLLLTRLGLHKPTELLKLAVTRARLCQSLGARHPDLNPQELFTAGLLSILDALFDRPMDAVLAPLPLAPTLKEALCGRTDAPIGAVLRRSVEWSAGAWDEACTAGEAAFDFALYLDAIEFADSALVA